MRARLRSAVLATALAFVPLPASLAQPELPPVSNSAQAASFLAAADPRQRAAALVWLSEHGREADAGVVVARLHDPHPVVRGLAQQVVWVLWSRSGDLEVDRLLEIGTRQMGGGALAEAIETFNDVIRRRPAFAEGWNKRATAYFLAGQYRKSIADCDEVVRRNPMHFGALSGYGQNYLQLQEYRLALDYFRRALTINPDMQGVQTNIRALEHRLEEQRRRST